MVFCKLDQSERLPWSVILLFLPKQSWAFHALTNPSSIWDASHLITSPGQHDVGVGAARAGACGAPFDGVDLLAVSLEVVNTGVLLHTPDLRDEDRYTGQNDDGSDWVFLCNFILSSIFRTFKDICLSHLQSHVIRAGGKQHPWWVPFNGIHFILKHRPAKHMKTV